jgi:protein-disulfide isomerase
MLAAVPLLTGSACEKKPKTADTGAVGAIDRAEKDSGPVDKTPLQGIDTSKLAGDRLDMFYKLVGSLNSPCGKPEPLRDSYAKDTACKRAPFAVKYLLQLIVDELPEDKVKDLWKKKYEAKDPVVKLDLAKAPRHGNTDAPIRIVEFYDYACPHCQAFAPVMKKVATDNEGKVVEYFMMYPLEAAHPQSRSAAQAALAAHSLGKFEDMHMKLFAQSPNHGKAAVEGYAKELGLDPAQFSAAYEAASAQVTADQKQGEALGVDSTPTVFFNERRYTGPLTPEYLELWIDEELAVNR